MHYLKMIWSKQLKWLLFLSSSAISNMQPSVGLVAKLLRIVVIIKPHCHSSLEFFFSTSVVNLVIGDDSLQFSDKSSETACR